MKKIYLPLLALALTGIGYTAGSASSTVLSCLATDSSAATYQCDANQRGLPGIAYDYCCEEDGVASNGCEKRAVNDEACGPGTNYNCCSGSGSSLACLPTAKITGQYMCNAADPSAALYCCKTDPGVDPSADNDCILFATANSGLCGSGYDYPYSLCCSETVVDEGMQDYPPPPATTTGSSAGCLGNLESNNYFKCAKTLVGLTGAVTNYCCTRKGSGTCVLATLGEPCDASYPYSSCCSGKGKSFQCLDSNDENALGSFVCAATDPSLYTACCADDPSAGPTECLEASPCPDSSQYPNTVCCPVAQGTPAPSTLYYPPPPVALPPPYPAGKAPPAPASTTLPAAPATTPAAATTTPAVVDLATKYENCINLLPKKLNMHWQLDNADPTKAVNVKIALEGALFITGPPGDTWLSVGFGNPTPPNPDKPVRGSDLVVVGAIGTSCFAVDFFLEGPTLCNPTNKTGVCPDVIASGLSTTGSTTLLTGCTVKATGLTVEFEKPLAAGDKWDVTWPTSAAGGLLVTSWGRLLTGSTIAIPKLANHISAIEHNKFTQSLGTKINSCSPIK